MKCPNWAYNGDRLCKKHSVLVVQAPESPPKKQKRAKIEEVIEEPEEVTPKFELTEEQKKASQRMSKLIKEVPVDGQGSKTSSLDSAASKFRKNQKVKEEPVEEEEEIYQEESEPPSEVPEFKAASYKSKAISMAIEDDNEYDDYVEEEQKAVWDPRAKINGTMCNGYFIVCAGIEAAGIKYGKNVSGLTRRLRENREVNEVLPFAMDQLMEQLKITGESISPLVALLIATGSVALGTFLSPDMPTQITAQPDVAPPRHTPQPDIPVAEEAPRDAMLL